MKQYTRNGQSIIELVVMIGVIVVIITGLVVASTTSLARSRSTRSRSLGTKYAQGGLELARNKRDQTSWANFVATYATPSPSVWCVNEDSSWQAASTCASSYNVASVYRRTVTLEVQSASKILVTATVTWRESQADATSTIQTYLTQWR